MSETKTPENIGATEQKKKSGLAQRVATAVVLVAILAVVLWAGGWVFALVACVCVGVAIHEMHNALRVGGHQPVSWVAYAGLVCSVPLMMFYSAQSMIPVLAVLCFCVLFQVMRRNQPELTDVLVSVMPLMSIVFPAMCLLGLLDTQPRSFQLMLLLQVFGIAVGGDTLAYFVGSSVGGPKLCPKVSPNKTISGSVGGLFGSVLVAFVVGRIFAAAVPDMAVRAPIWGDLLVGLIGGAAGQMGDLFASMVKRHCQVKDYGTIFPGHGGMMDRLDSIFFVAIIVYCYRVILLA
ncbi:MAG: hypothetical protein E7323_10520 [Clostridiales bacterium]|nr:hypothetical protein [Clostridiales bacterium]